jgi:hypothetical protein
MPRCVAAWPRFRLAAVVPPRSERALRPIFPATCRHRRTHSKHHQYAASDARFSTAAARTLQSSLVQMCTRICYSAFSSHHSLVVSASPARRATPRDSMNSSRRTTHATVYSRHAEARCENTAFPRTRGSEFVSCNDIVALKSHTMGKIVSCKNTAGDCCSTGSTRTCIARLG